MPSAPPRLVSVDFLRGLVMVIMALDHARDFFSHDANLFDPTDLAHTTPALFFTRWITHFCAPIFVFLAGTGAYLSLTRGKSPTALARFLITRGLWLIFLEFLVISPLGWSLSLNFAFTRLQVIWVIGVAMVLLGVLVPLLPSRLIGAMGVIMILGHNLFDRTAGAWQALHQILFFEPVPHKVIASLYPLIPWVGVMMAGYAAGEFLLQTPEQRRRILFRLGTLLTLSFIALRATNWYGDASPWATQANPVYTLLSFLRCSKYPPSLLYLLMTLGPALLILAAADRGRGRWFEFFRDFGRVPLFYYLLHLPILHGAAALFSYLQYGSAAWIFQDLMTARRSPHPLPPDYGYGLPVVYAVWLATVLLLYPLCRWFANVKKTRKEAIFGYL